MTALPTERLTLPEAIELAAIILRGPVVGTFPCVNPDTWRDMRCRLHPDMPSKYCHCDFCIWERRYRPAVDEWQLSQERFRPHARHELPFGSLSAALEAMLRQRNGATVRSQAGSLIDRAASINALETTVQVTRRYDRDDRTTRDAELAVDVERSVVHAYREEPARRGLRTGACITILLSSVEASAPSPEAWAGRLGVPTSTVIGVVRSGRRGATVDLAARGIIPEPRAATMTRATEARRKELAR